MRKFIYEQGPAVRCEHVQKGEYHCETENGVDIAAAALINGAATTSKEAPESYKSYEQDAKANKRGMWDGNDG